MNFTQNWHYIIIVSYPQKLIMKNAFDLPSPSALLRPFPTQEDPSLTDSVGGPGTGVVVPSAPPTWWDGLPSKRCPPVPWDSCVRWEGTPWLPLWLEEPALPCPVADEGWTGVAIVLEISENQQSCYIAGFLSKKDKQLNLWRLFTLTLCSSTHCSASGSWVGQGSTWNPISCYHQGVLYDSRKALPLL